MLRLQKTTTRSRLWRAALGSLPALIVALALAVPLRTSAANALPAGLPSHFGFGIAGHPDNTGIYGWMPQSGIPWDYAYQYLSGGVNTGSGWETWNASGQFPLFYAQGAASHGYIPMFPYYEILQSKSSCSGCNEGQTDLTNLNDASVMNAYFANFALLMQRLGPGTYGGITGFGKTALVNIEPDFSGGYTVQAANNVPNGACYGFCTGQGNNPSYIKAAVASSGYAGVSGYANTYAGFVQALAHLRDLYAPNVLLGLEVSPWATGDDIGLDTSSTTNAGALGQEVGSFLSQTAAANDILFNNPLDRDAGQYLAQFGQNRWWDRLNVTYPNFHRWEQYLQAASQADGSKSILLWQVPVGNQYFDTENNTNGHFQDNRPEYIFSHVQELIQSGIIGAMFGLGNSGSTNYYDAVGDGVTNPGSFCTTSGISTGQICNNHTSAVSDDDGGYIRSAAQQYYTSPVSLGAPGVMATSTPTPSPTAVPATATATATVAATSTTAATATATATAGGTSNNTSAISFRSASGTDTTGSTLTIAAPSGVAQNDVLVAAVYWDGSGKPSISPPTGWHLVRQDGSSRDQQVAIYYTVAGATAPANYSWTSSKSQALTGIISDYTGVNTSNPIDVQGGATGTSTNAAAPSVTTSTSNDLLIGVWSAWNGNLTLSPPSGMTARFGFSNNDPITLADKSIGASGSTGTQTETSSSAPGFWTGQSVALRPAGTSTSGATNTPTNTPTTAPTSTRTPTPTNTPVSTSTPAPTASYTTSAMVSPATVAPASSESITTSVQSSAAATVLVDMEVYDPTGTKVFQQYWDNQSFTAGQTRTYSSSYAVSSTAVAGTYTVKIGIFSPAWGALYTWNNGAAVFSVS
jgi:hypothetical protein